MPKATAQRYPGQDRARPARGVPPGARRISRHWHTAKTIEACGGLRLGHVAPGRGLEREGKGEAGQAKPSRNASMKIDKKPRGLGVGLGGGPVQTPGVWRHAGTNTPDRPGSARVGLDRVCGWWLRGEVTAEVFELRDETWQESFILVFSFYALSDDSSLTEPTKCPTTDKSP